VVHLSPPTTPPRLTQTMATAFRALRLAQRAPVLRQMPTSRIVSAVPRAYATATIREARPDKPADQVEQASEDLSGGDPMMNGNYPDPSKTSALPLKRQFRDPHAEWWDPQERRNYGEPVHEVRKMG
jgi:NADH dehydrogenase (ubiquinone) 1 beta subcomplex subunit 8